MTVRETTHVFRPSIRTYGKSTLVRAALVLPVLGVLIWLNDDRPSLRAILAGVGAACILGVLTYIAWARVYVTDTKIGKRGFGLTRWMDKAAVHRTLLVLDLRSSGAAQSALFLFAPDGVRVMRLSGDIWAETDLRAIAEATGGEQSVYTQPIAMTEFAKTEPTALNWAETHPKEVAWYVGGAFIAFAVFVVFVMYNSPR